MAWKKCCSSLVRPVLFLDIDCRLLCVDFVVVVCLKRSYFIKAHRAQVYKYDRWGNDLMIMYNFTLPVLPLVLVCWNYQLYCAQAVLGDALSCSSIAPFTSQTHLQRFRMFLEYCFAFSFTPFLNY